jgi:O-antigen ligase
VFVLSQRRAAMVGLVGGFLVFCVVLFFRRRRAFFVIVPIAVVLTSGYTVAFWNATDGVGFGAQAIKTVIAPGAVSEKDRSSDLYRDIENFDLAYTVRTTPIVGVGFGKPFYRPIPLPDISFFIFYEYIPHNSILWIWLKMGYFGFVSMLYVFASSFRAGTRASLRMPEGNALAVTVAAFSSIVMFMVFAYVDIAWTSSACVFLAVGIATCGNILRVSGVDPDRPLEPKPDSVELGSRARPALSGAR